LDALIFDFDGVVVDSEPIHFATFRRVLASRGCELARNDYYTKYIGYDDHDAFVACFRDHGLTVEEAEVATMTAEKTAMVKKAFAESIKPLPGAVDLIRSATAAGISLAICSGALKQEITLAAEKVGVLDDFAVIVSAEDVRRSKPDAEGYRLALKMLSEATGRKIAPAKSLAIEDSPAGIEAAKTAGLKALAVTNSYAAGALKAADRVVDSLAGLGIKTLEELL